tara:strand:- start:15180 stop:15458 length:279 start_codon:yes stop_codon:yes gene_type:complete
MKTIEEKMLEANKARTEILADNPEINSKWTPDAIKIVKSKKETERPVPLAPLSPFSNYDDRHDSDAEEFRNESKRKDFDAMKDAGMSMSDFL